MSKNISNKFDVETLEELIYGDGPEEYKVLVGETITDKTRWSVHYELVFTFEDKFYKMSWSGGATEYQDEPFEPYVVEVIPVEITTTIYKEV